MDEKTLIALKERWDDLIAAGQSMTFRKGQVLFYEGHDPYGLIVLKSGKVQFSRGGRCNHEHFWVSPRGKVLGLDPFFDGTPYCCTCLAATDCRLTLISKTQLISFLRAPSK